MQLEDYFEFEKFETEHGLVERIRIKGHRIAIEHVIQLYQEGVSPEKIVSESYPTLALDEAYATILYYLRNRERVDEYIRCATEVEDAYYQEFLRHGPYWIKDKALGKINSASSEAGKSAHE